MAMSFAVKAKEYTYKGVIYFKKLCHMDKMNDRKNTDECGKKRYDLLYLTEMWPRMKLQGKKDWHYRSQLIGI